jgi:hypothetical protein
LSSCLTRSNSIFLRRTSFSPALRSLRRTVETFFKSGEIGERKLRIDRLDVGNRIDASGYVDDICAVERAHDVRDRINLADVREELISQALALRCAGDEPGDINKLNGRWQDLLRLRDGRELGEARIRYGHDADIWVDRTERIVFCGDLRTRQSVEER